MKMHEVELKAVGFTPSRELVIAIGDHLEGLEGFVDPIVSADIATGVIEVNVEVAARSSEEAYDRAARALGEAVVAAGAAESWLRAAERQAVVA
jgi:hypothetical protein